jgi:hypothetical protein
MKVVIAKYEEYPYENPIGLAVGFKIAVNDRQFYIDTIVDNDKIIDKSEDEILSIAWEELKDQIEVKVEELLQLSPLVGQIWNPPVEEPLEELEELEAM